MKNFMMVLVATLLTFGGVTISGCGASTPKTVEAQNHIHQYVQERTYGRVEVVGFKKTDGQRKTIRGVESYVLEYEAKALFLERCLSTRALGGGVILCSEKYPDFDSMVMIMMSDTRSKFSGTTDKGKKISISGSVTFEKKESGWHVDDHTLKIEADEIEWGTHYLYPE